VVNDPLQYKGSGSTSRATGRRGARRAGGVSRKDGTPVGAFALAPNEPVPIDGYGIVRG